MRSPASIMISLSPSERLRESAAAHALGEIVRRIGGPRRGASRRADPPRTDHRVIFLVIYLGAVWWLAHWLRRRWIGFAVAGLSVFPVAAAAAALPELLGIGVSMRSPAMATLPIAYAGLVCAGAALIAAQPRRPAVGCSGCGYDLAGNTLGVCPECGAPTRAARAATGHTATGRSATGRTTTGRRGADSRAK